jgi:predicted dienelactone hydrolase
LVEVRSPLETLEVNMKFLAIVLILALAVAAYAADQPGLPKPTGKYPVGTTRLAFTDTTRTEPFTEDPDDRREVTVTVWYPAEAAKASEGGIAAPYYEHADKVVTGFGYLAPLADLTTHAFKDAPASKKQPKYPVILFNHGWGEHAGQNTILMEELASQGYVVFSISHHYEGKFWIYPDGQIRFLDPQSPGFKKIMAEQSKPGMMDLFNEMFTTKGVAEQETLFRRTVELMPAFLLESPRFWAKDIVFIIDRLEMLNASDGLFKGKLDLDRIGVMGMSMGGVAAGQACIDDERIRAGINCDGGLFGDLVDTAIATPFMFMGSKRFIDYEEVFAKHTSGDAYTLTIPEADHYDFTDMTLLLREHPMIGTVDGSRMIKIVNAYTLAFFDTYLRGKPAKLLQADQQPYPEAGFKAYKAKRPAAGGQAGKQ